MIIYERHVQCRVLSLEIALVACAGNKNKARTTDAKKNNNNGNNTEHQSIHKS